MVRHEYHMTTEAELYERRAMVPPRGVRGRLSDLSEVQLSDGELRWGADNISHDSGSIGSSDSDDEQLNVRDTFKRAKHFVEPSNLFRKSTNLYTNRTTFLVLTVHLLVTGIIWSKFAILREKENTPNIDPEAAFYTLRKFGPPILYGSKHAILFQMALLPLTMSRFSITVAAESFLKTFIPFDRITFLHVYLGYFMIGLVCFATMGFIVFYGILCGSGEEEFCSKLYSEIMLTGYGITLCAVAVGITSYFRNKIPYEIFYAVHQTILLLYGVTMLHTFDDLQRNGYKNRSQTFLWISVSLLYYICDRLYTRMHRRYRLRLESFSCVSGFEKNSQKMLILRLRNTPLVQFAAGQYAFLQFGEIDKHWHPFSFASGPESECIEFYIQAQEGSTWTMKLYSYLESQSALEDVPLYINMMGPYGTSLATTSNFTHAVCVGTGTGIVPMVSLLKQHVYSLLRLDPERHFHNIQTVEKRIALIERAGRSQKTPLGIRLWRSMFKDDPSNNDKIRQKAELRRSIQSTLKKLDQASAAICSSSDTSSETEDQATAAFLPSRPRQTVTPEYINGLYDILLNATFEANASIYGVMLLSIVTLFGILLLAFATSWETLCGYKRDFVLTAFCVSTVFFQTLFSIISLFVWNGGQLLAFLDAALTILFPFVDWYWAYFIWSDARELKVISYMFVHIYLVYRFWSAVIRVRHVSIREKARVSNGYFHALECLEFVWVSRSAALVSRLLPELNSVWLSLVDKWGHDRALEVCKIKVHVTDRDKEATAALHRIVAEHGIPPDWIVSSRPDFEDILSRHTVRVLTAHRRAYSLLAYCGSTKLGSLLHETKIFNDTLVGLTGLKDRFQMTFVQESYGGASSAPTKKKTS